MRWAGGARAESCWFCGAQVARPLPPASTPLGLRWGGGGANKGAPPKSNSLPEVPGHARVVLRSHPGLIPAPSLSYPFGFCPPRWGPGLNTQNGLTPRRPLRNVGGSDSKGIRSSRQGRKYCLGIPRAACPRPLRGVSLTPTIPEGWKGRFNVPYGRPLAGDPLSGVSV